MTYQEKPLFSVTSRTRLKRLLPKSMYLRCFGRHERLSLHIWEILSAQIAPDRSILDIGSFYGEFALLARHANKSTKIFAFEPNPESLAILRTNCRSNQIDIVGKAISDENEKVYFHCDSQISAITSTISARPTNGWNTIEVDTITLDSWSKHNSEVPGLIKIDVEDAADRVLRGAKQVLNEHKPIIICEILNHKIGKNVMASLKNYYNLFLINENWGLEKKNSVKRYDWRYKNWLFVPIEDKASMESLRSQKVCVKEVS